MRKIFLLAFAGLLASCTKTPEPIKIEGFAQGTTYHLTALLPKPEDQALVAKEVTDELKRIDASISNYRKDSTIELFNAQLDTEPHEVNEEIVKLVEQARAISKASKGCYDLTIKPLFDLWGFKKNVFNLPSDEVLQQTLQLVGMDKLITVDATHLQKTLPNLRVDLSSIGQGYSVGRLADILEKHGATSYIVEIGGEMKVRGKKADGSPWRIAMEKPISTERKVEKVAIFATGEPVSLMPSGTYHHYFDSNGKRFSHILDGRTGKPIEHKTAMASAFMADPALADAWSTTLLCVGSDVGIQLANEHGIAALFVDQEGEQLIEKKSSALEKLTSVKLEDAKQDQ
ncbi:FAD:protein FMN transferase [Cellvibrio zantedeschiae]|uniref:FAD:protein FMN transferase n=1 Tax=Cellvibrio zantedeschiae TaxID=1237077 RepID=A0ABQ3APV9_9GAMM|nr:FAD:protein FMN transferase [Cellvibrio zantedeschiae]GGY62328.1 FAD:protein FMN transferase [Cellvibrio zantedeschiae]